MTKMELIHQYAKKGYRSYTELSRSQKRALVACMIREQCYADKASLLVDADREASLPDLVANAIETNAQSIQVIELMQAILEMFVYKQDAFFEAAVDEALEDESRGEPLDYIDDIKKQDAAERARDMRKAV